MPELPEMDLPFAVGGMLNGITSRNYAITASATLTQPIYMGGVISNGIKIARQSKDIYNLQVTAVQRDVIKDITQAYYTVLGIQKSIIALDTSIALLEQISNDLKNSVEVGIRGEHELLQTEVQLLNQKIARQQTYSGLVAAKGRLATLTGRNIDEDLILADTIIEPQSFDIPSLDTLRERMRSSLPEIKQLDKQIQINEITRKITRAAYLPNVFGNASFSGQTNTYGDDLKFKDTWTVSLMAKWNIYDWGATHQKEMQSVSQEKQLKLTREELLNGMELLLRTNYLSLKDAFDNIEITRKGIEQSKRSYEIAYDKFGQGLSTYIELLTAQSTKLQSEILYYNAIKDYYSKRAELEYYINLK